jgi:hypothetical protein
MPVLFVGLDRDRTDGGVSIAPRAVRLVASGLAAAVVADSSQHAYAGLRKASS